MRTMKTKILNTALFALLFVSQIFAQDVTTVRANNSDISDNLDLRAVASIFGESRDLEDFERRLNNPEYQISNLDLNGDNRVDYLRVIEAAENNTHLIILQSVLGLDTYQDVATIEVEKRGNNVQVQVVGDVYMYGPNYIYEPVYVTRPAIYDIFWVSTYRPYYSPWYWGYYPTYYTYWSPWPVYRYRNHIHVHINNYNTYNYVNVRRSSRAVALHNTRRTNSYERQYPDRSFTSRNSNATNRYALEQNRESARVARSSSSRNSFTNSSRNSGTSAGRSVNTATRDNGTVRVTTPSRNTETISSGNSSQSVRSSSTRNNTVVRSNPSQSRTETYQPQTSRQNTEIRSTQPARSSAPEVRRSSTPQRNSAPAVRSTPTRSSAPSMRTSSPQRQSTPAMRSGGSRSRNSRG